MVRGGSDKDQSDLDQVEERVGDRKVMVRLRVGRARNPPGEEWHETRREKRLLCKGYNRRSLEKGRE